MLQNSKIAVKAIVPLILMAIVAAGLVFYSLASLDQLAKQTRDIVDLQAVRLEKILRTRSHVNEMAIQSRNMILETGEKEMAESGLPPFGGPGLTLVHRRSCDDGRSSGRH